MSLKSKWKKLWQKIKDWLNPPPEPEPDPPPPEPTPPDPEPPAPPAPGEFKVDPKWTGFLWKPIGENSKKLRVLLPPEWKRDKFDLNRVEIWSGGKKLETIDSIGPGNPLPGRGEREHFAGVKQGGAYPVGCTVRAKTIAGEEWEWLIAKPASRNENVRAVQRETD